MSKTHLVKNFTYSRKTFCGRKTYKLRPKAWRRRNPHRSKYGARLKITTYPRKTTCKTCKKVQRARRRRK